MSKRVGPFGGDDVDVFNDGVYDRLMKVCVGEDGDRVSSVAIQYGWEEDYIIFCHGKTPQNRKEFILDGKHGEYIKSVEGTYDYDGFISSLTFITSMGRKSEEFGKAGYYKFTLKVKGFDKLVGFHGRSSDDGINALGGHFVVVVPPPIMKLGGGEGVGEIWDDEVYEIIREITVGLSGISVVRVEFKYYNGTEIVVRDPHGNNSWDQYSTMKISAFSINFLTQLYFHIRNFIFFFVCVILVVRAPSK